MIQVKITSNTARPDPIAMNEKTATPKDALVQAGVSLNGVTISLDGGVLNTQNMNTTFEDLGIAADSTCYLSAVTKATNA